MARILVGVSGGIAAYKSLELARLATKEGHAVRVLMTPAAQRFVGAASFEGITGAPVLTDEFERDPTRGAFPGDPVPEHDPIGHLEVVANADAYLIAPASANTIAKLAAGIADSMVTTSFLACSAPRLVAPAMNDRMYRDPATQENLATLRRRGIIVIEPEEGAAARAACAARRDRAHGPRPDRPLGRPPGPDLRRRHPRADRSRPLHRQSLLGPHGPRPRRAGGPARSGGDSRGGQRVDAGPARRAARGRRNRRGPS